MSYTHNKYPKDPNFCKIMRRTINKDRKLNGFTLEEEAHELGLNQGTLEQKMKPSSNNDFSISEVMHVIEMSGDYSPLEYLAEKYDFTLVKKREAAEVTEELHTLSDKAMIENSDVFRVVTVSMADGEIDDDEKARILKEINEAQKANADLKAYIESLG